MFQVKSLCLNTLSSGDKVTRTLNVGAGWKSEVNFTHESLILRVRALEAGRTPELISMSWQVKSTLSYGLDDRGSRVLFPAVAVNFHNRVQNGSGAHPAFYPKVTGGSFSGGKAAGA